MIKNEVIFAIPAHERPNVVHEVVKNLKQKAEKHLSVSWDILICSEYGSEVWSVAEIEMTQFVHDDNSLLGSKFNNLLRHAHDYGRYIVILGSDDILTKEYFVELDKIIKHDAIFAAGLKSALFCGVDSLEVYNVIHRDNSWVGSGLIVRDCIVESLDFDVFPKLQKGLDRAAHNKIKKEIQYQRKQYGDIVPDHNGLIALKEVDNIHDFDFFKKWPEMDFETDINSEDRETILNIQTSKQWTH